MKKRKRKPIPIQNKWQSNPDDAIKLAAIRWFACAIEMEAIQIYATSPAQYTAIEGKLGDCIDALHTLKKDFVGGDDEDCPPGYTMCGSECAPRCPQEPANE